MTDLPTPRTADTITFLQGRVGFPTLSASWTDPETGAKSKFETKSFPPVEGQIPWALARGWIDERQGKANLYFSVNPLVKAQDKKTERTDIEAVTDFHIDVDARVGETQEDAIVRISKMFDQYRVRPSYVIISGGGAQAFWRLREPIVIDGDLEKAEDAKLFNVQIERDLGGDNCHNIDRIMRLPGTINIPTATKLKKGRKASLAYLLYNEPERTYALDTFAKAPKIQEVERAGPGAPAAPRTAASEGTVISGNYEDMDYSDPRLSGLAQRFKDLAVDGVKPDGDEDQDYGRDRSRAAFGFVCACIRALIDDNVIASCLMTKSWKIGECIREKKNVDRELRRIIARGHEFCNDPDLAYMNDEYCVIKLGRGYVIMTYEESLIYPGRLIPSFVSKEGFEFFFTNKRKLIKVLRKKKDKDGKPTGEEEEAEMSVNKGKWWIEHGRRREYGGGMQYMPHIEADVVGRPGHEVMNLWTGFTVAPNPAVQPVRYLEHLKDNICSGNEEHYQYLIQWMAHCVQRRDKPGEIAVCLQGDEGVGKGVAIKTFGQLFGPHFMHVTNPEHITGKFNAHLETISLLFGDECFYAGDKKHEQILKVLITEPTIMVEPKGVNAYESKNYLHIMLATNADWAVPVSATGRRWFVLAVKDTQRANYAYFQAIEDEMKNGGRAGLLDFLLRMDLSKFDVRECPKTEAYDNQKDLTRSGVDAMIEHLCRDGMLPAAHSNPSIAITSGEDDGRGFWAWSRNTFPELRYRKPSSIGKELATKWGCNTWCGNRIRGIQFPQLPELRIKFDKKHGNQKWNAAPSWGAAVGEPEPADKKQIPF